jgi:hypothetical protein
MIKLKDDIRESKIVHIKINNELKLKMRETFERNQKSSTNKERFNLDGLINGYFITKKEKSPKTYYNQFQRLYTFLVNFIINFNHNKYIDVSLGQNKYASTKFVFSHLPECFFQFQGCKINYASKIKLDFKNYYNLPMKITEFEKLKTSITWCLFINSICGEVFPIKKTIHKRGTESIFDLLSEEVQIFPLSSNNYVKYEIKDYNLNHIINKHNEKGEYRYDLKNMLCSEPYFILHYYANDGLFLQSANDEEIREKIIKIAKEIPKKIASEIKYQTKKYDTDCMFFDENEII